MTTDQSPPSDDFDVRVGGMVQALRRVKNMTQQELADEVSRLGLAWRQQTVLKVEKGHRPLRLQEAEVVAKVLAVDLPTLVNDEQGRARAKTMMAWGAHQGAVEGSWRDLVESGKRLLGGVDQLSDFLVKLARTGQWEHLGAARLEYAVGLVTTNFAGKTVEELIDMSLHDYTVEPQEFDPEAWA